jgi:hypothetical protein
LFTPLFYGIDPANTNAFGGRPDCLANGNLPKSERTLDRYFDTSAFAAPPADAGRYGTCGGNILEGPGFNILHAGLMKEVPLHEKFTLRLEAVATNVLNHPNFGQPGNSFDATLDPAAQAANGYGVITGTSFGGGPSVLSLTLRLTF